MLMSDDSIIKCLEFLIDNNTIKIPSTEIRKSHFGFKYTSFYNTKWETSNLGIRPIPGSIDIAIARLKGLAKEIYKDDVDGLNWTLRHINGKDIYEKLDNFVYNENPKDLIKILVFSNENNLKKTFEILRYGNFNLPTSKEEENKLIDKIIWKLGFNINVFPNYQNLFWKRLNAFLDVLNSYSLITEQEEETVRSKGANFFVSLEQILGYSLSFITWALLEDHYINTKFNFNFETAMIFMANTLNNELTDKDNIEYDPSGKNTLYPLIRGFKILADICKKLIAEEEKRKRSEKDLPRYYGKTDIVTFPFLHKNLLLDIKQNERELLINYLEEISNDLERTQISNIRNKISHKRSKFPKRDEIIESVSEVSKIIDKMENFGICPLVYLFDKSIDDQFNRTKIILSNYRAKKNEIHMPSQFVAPNMPSTNSALILIPELHMRDSNENISFNFLETSDHVEMWKDYPKRKY